MSTTELKPGAESSSFKMNLVVSLSSLVLTVVGMLLAIKTDDWRVQIAVITAVTILATGVISMAVIYNNNRKEMRVATIEAETVTATKEIEAEASKEL